MSRSLVVQLEALIDQYKRDMESAARSTRDVGEAAKEAGEQATKSTEGQRRSLVGWVTENEQAFQAMERSGKGMTKAVTGPLVALGGAITATGVSYNALEQRSRAALTTLTGSAEEANAQMDRLHEFGSTSPFPRQTWIEAQQQLIGFGMEADSVIDVLGAVQDAVAATGGTSQDIAEVVDVLARIQGQGRITGVELQRLGIRGIDAANMLADHFGMSGDELRRAVSEGAIDADMAIAGLVAGIDDKMGGAAENMRHTWDGATDRVKAAFRDLSAAIIMPFVDPEGGGSAVDAANAFADALRSMEAAWRDLDPAQQNALLSAAGFIAAIGPGLWTVGRFARAVKNTKENLALMKPLLRGAARFLLGPWGIALGAATVAVGGFIQRRRELESNARLWLDILGDEVDIINLTVDALDDLSDATRQEFFRGLVDQHPQLMSMFADYGLTLDDLVDYMANAEQGGTAVHDVLARLWDTPSHQPFAEALNDVSGEFAHAAENAEVWEAVAGDAADASDDAADSVGGLAGEFGGLAIETDLATLALERYLDDVRAAEDPVFALNRAVRGVEDAHRSHEGAIRTLGDAQENLTEVQRDVDASSRDLADAQRAVEDAERGVVDASWDVMSALSDVERAVLDGDLSWGAFDRRLKMWVEQGQVTAGQASDIRERVRELMDASDDYDGRTFRGHYDADVDTGIERLDSFTRAADAAARDRTMRLNMTVVGSQAMDSWARQIPGRASGGPVWPGQPFVVGEQGPEIVTFANHGMVHDAPTTARALQAPVVSPSGAGRALRGGGASNTRTFEVTQHIYGRPDPVADFRARDSLRQLATSAAF